MALTFKLYDTPEERLEAAKIAMTHRLFISNGYLRDHYRLIKGIDVPSPQLVKEYLVTLIAFNNDFPIASAMVMDLQYNGPHFQVFVRNKYRRQGIGKTIHSLALQNMVAKGLMKLDQKFYVMGWNSSSDSFFEHVGRHYTSIRTS